MKASGDSDVDAKFTLEDAWQVLKEREMGPSAAIQDGLQSSEMQIQTAVRRTKTPTVTGTMKVRAVSVADILGVKSLSSDSDIMPLGEAKIEKKYAKYYDKLLHLREELRLRLQRRTNETLKLSKGEEIDMPHVLGQHTADGASAQVDLEMALSVFENEQELLAEIEAAIERLLNGTYGTCERTGLPIAEGRLEALPFTRYSLEGQQQLEREKSLKASTGRREGPLFLYHEEDTAIGSNGSEDE